VLIEGRLRLDTWEDEGKNRSKLRVVGERLQMLGVPKNGKGKPAEAPAETVAVSDDIPF
jgi:single-strand DNA-binding protein